MTDINDNTPLEYMREREPETVSLWVRAKEGGYIPAIFADLRTILRQHPAWVEALGLGTNGEQDIASSNHDTIMRAHDALDDAGIERGNLWLHRRVELLAGERDAAAKREEDAVHDRDAARECVVGLGEIIGEQGRTRDEFARLYREAQAEVERLQSQLGGLKCQAEDDAKIAASWMREVDRRTKERDAVTGKAEEYQAEVERLKDEGALREAVDICAQVESELLSESAGLLDGYAREAMANAAGAAMCGRRLRAALAAAPAPTSDVLRDAVNRFLYAPDHNYLSQAAERETEHCALVKVYHWHISELREALAAAEGKNK